MVQFLWGGLFAIWAAFLSGAFAQTVGSPGVLQWVRLNRLLESKGASQAELEARVQALDAESARLERSRYAQELEIRKVLGYASADELIFDFSDPTEP
jgi:cell division protein FtsB